METKNNLLALVYLWGKTETERQDASLWLEQAVSEEDWVLRLVLLSEPNSHGLYMAKEDYQDIQLDPQGEYQRIKLEAEHLVRLRLANSSIRRGGVMLPIACASPRGSRYEHLIGLSLILERIYGCCLPEDASSDSSSEDEFDTSSTELEW